MARDATALNQSNPITEDQVEDFLRDHPDFLTHHPALLDVMTPPIRWSGDKVVDMQSFMLDRLRGEQVDLKDAANLLISTTRANMMIQTRTHAAALALLGAEDLEKLIHTTCFDLPLLLEVDAVSLCFETGDTVHPGLGSMDIRWFAPGTIDTVLGNREDYAKLLEYTSDDGSVFGEAAGIVQSAALARVGPGGTLPAGLLALGSRTRGAFHGGQGTDLLIFLTRVLENCLLRHFSSY
ncbi:MAG: hypothetical protein CMM45_01150 [Rhodospirillaceae bacterium]|nr:hypothetical protein [Rhodospirillaceae bacterium]